MRINFVGIVGCILAFISILFPWWTLSGYGAGFGSSYQIYLYETTTVQSTLFGGLEAGTKQPELYVWLAFALLIAGSFLGLVSSLTGQRTLLFFSACLAIISPLFFAFALAMDLKPGIGLFSSGYVSGGTFSSYLDVGFWLALVGAILIISSLALKIKDEVAVPPFPQATYQQPYAPQQQYPQQQIKRFCPQCGRVVDENLKFCPNCGKSLG